MKMTTCSMSLRVPQAGAASALLRMSPNPPSPIARLAAAPPLRTSRREGVRGVLPNRLLQAVQHPRPHIVRRVLPLRGAEEAVGCAVVDLELGTDALVP